MMTKGYSSNRLFFFSTIAHFRIYLPQRCLGAGDIILTNSNTIDVQIRELNFPIINTTASCKFNAICVEIDLVSLQKLTKQYHGKCCNQSLCERVTFSSVVTFIFHQSV